MAVPITLLIATSFWPWNNVLKLGCRLNCRSSLFRPHRLRLDGVCFAVSFLTPLLDRRLKLHGFPAFTIFPGKNVLQARRKDKSTLSTLRWSARISGLPFLSGYQRKHLEQKSTPATTSSPSSKTNSSSGKLPSTGHARRCNNFRLMGESSKFVRENPNKRNLAIGFADVGIKLCSGCFQFLVSGGFVVFVFDKKRKSGF